MAIDSVVIRARGGHSKENKVWLEMNANTIFALVPKLEVRCHCHVSKNYQTSSTSSTLTTTTIALICTLDAR